MVTINPNVSLPLNPVHTRPAVALPSSPTRNRPGSRDALTTTRTIVVAIALAAACGERTIQVDGRVALRESAPRDINAGCPDEMVRVPNHPLCVDRYEASKSGVTAVSIAGAEPWVQVTYHEADAACGNVGKRLCTTEEWERACQGPLRPQRCNVKANGPGKVLPTGSIPACEGGYPGIYDIFGNVAELVNDPRGTPGIDNYAMGGFFTWDGDLRCTTYTHSTIGPSMLVGFRCCRIPQ